MLLPNSNLENLSAYLPNLEFGDKQPMLSRKFNRSWLHHVDYFSFGEKGMTNSKL